MIRFPDIFVIGDTLLDEALKILDPIQFKVFIYLVRRAQNYEESGAGYDGADLDELESILKLNYNELVSSFIEIRRQGWLDDLQILQHNRPYGNDYIGRIDFRWYMALWYPGEVIEECCSFEDDWPSWWHDKHDLALVIGTDIVAEPLDPAIARRRPGGKHWHYIRQKVLDRDKQCTKCGETKKLHVHHLTYENEGAERMDDLVTLCQSCHAKQPKILSKELENKAIYGR